jgi:hypothetical protein
LLLSPHYQIMFPCTAPCVDGNESVFSVALFVNVLPVHVETLRKMSGSQFYRANRIVTRGHQLSRG